MVLVGRKAAARVNAHFALDRERLIMMGFDHEDIDQVEWVVKEIERTIETQLTSLQQFNADDGNSR